MIKNISAIFAHPDDEILACGGALALHKEKGDFVNVLLLSTGLNSRDENQLDISKLREQAKNANEILGIDNLVFGDFPDNAMDTVPLLQVIKRIEDFLKLSPPDILYTHHAGDLNIDHEITNRAVMTACRPIPGRKPCTLLACEVNSSTEWSSIISAPFVPTEFLDITSTISKKIDALKCYEGEIRSWPHPRSCEGIKVQANYRGGQIGVNAAEAFVTLRRINSIY